MRAGSARGVEGIRVLQLSEGIAGSYCCHLLADAGADVVKVEAPGGDPLRHWTKGGPHPLTQNEGDSPLFCFLHHGVRSVVGGPEDAAVQALMAASDLVVESGNLGLDEIGRLLLAHPKLVIASITPFGRSGPYAERPASELTVQAESGALLFRGSRNADQ